MSRYCLLSKKRLPTDFASAAVPEFPDCFYPDPLFYGANSGILHLFFR